MTLLLPLRTRSLCAAWRRGLLAGMLAALATPAFGQSFAPLATYPAVAATTLSTPNTGLTVADVNNDGKADMLVAGGGSLYSMGSLGVLLGVGNGTFQPALISRFSGYGSISDLAVGDVNGDGQRDVVALDYDNGLVYLLVGSGNGTFQYGGYVLVGGQYSAPQRVQLADVNGDAKPDILVTSSVLGVVVLLQDATGTGYSSRATYATGLNESPFGLAVADVNRDGQPDLVAANPTHQFVSVLLGTGSGAFGTAATYSTNAPGASYVSTPYNVAVADVNGDSQPDIITANYTTGNIGVLLGTGTGTFGVATTYPTSASPFGVAVADVSGDGRLDVITTSGGQMQANSVGVLLGTGTGTFGPPVAFATGVQPRQLVVADVNGDSHPDVLTALYTNTLGGAASQIGVLLNTATYLATRPELATAQATLWPNPAPAGAAQLLVAGLPTASRLEATLLTATGQVSRRFSLPVTQGTARAELPTQGLPAGLYLLVLHAHNAQGQFLGTLAAQRLAVQ